MNSGGDITMDISNNIDRQELEQKIISLGNKPVIHGNMYRNPFVVLGENMANPFQNDPSILEHFQDVAARAKAGQISYLEAKITLEQIDLRNYRCALPWIIKSELGFIAAREPWYYDTGLKVFELARAPLNLAGSYPYHAAYYVQTIEEQLLVDFFKTITDLYNSPNGNVDSANFYLSEFFKVCLHFNKNEVSVQWNFDPITSFLQEMTISAKNLLTWNTLIDCMEGRISIPAAIGLVEPFDKLEIRCMGLYHEKCRNAPHQLYKIGSLIPRYTTAESIPSKAKLAEKQEAAATKWAKQFFPELTKRDIRDFQPLREYFSKIAADPAIRMKTMREVATLDSLYYVLGIEKEPATNIGFTTGFALEEMIMWDDVASMTFGEVLALRFPIILHVHVKHRSYHWEFDGTTFKLRSFTKVPRKG